MLANELRERVRFEQRALDDNGDRLGDWDPATALEVAAGFVRLRQGEKVMQGRLEGQSPVVIRVRASAATRAISAAWRAVDVRTGEAFELTSRGDAAEDRAFLDFLATAVGSDD